MSRRRRGVGEDGSQSRRRSRRRVSEKGRRVMEYEE